MLHLLALRFRRAFPWSNSRQAWKERSATVFLVAGLACIVWFGGGLSTAAYTACWALLLCTMAALVRAGSLRLFGPLFLYDLVRTIRRSRIVLLRIIYTLSLLVLLLCLYLLLFYDNREGMRGLFAGSSVSPGQLANFASGFSFGFMAIELFMVFLLVPAYTAGAIAEEKERGTLEAMFITDLRNREIVLGMVAARLGTMLLIVLGGLPILAILQFMGGIDPNIVLAGFAFTGLSMVGLAGVSILHSVYASKTRRALVLTYLTVGAYLILSGLSQLLLLPQLGLATFPSTGSWVSPVTSTDVVEWFNAGNIFTVTIQLSGALARGGRIETLLARALSMYAWFHGLAAVVGIGLAILRLRVIALRAGTTTSKMSATLSALDWMGMGMGRWPMVWKALVVEARARRGLLGRLLTGLLVAALMWPGILVCHFFGRISRGGPFDPLANLLSLWIRGASLLIGSFLLLSVAVRACGGICGERERQTLDGLLATTLTNRAILFGKWLGSIANDRWSWFWLGVVWSVGIISGALHPLAIPYFLLAWLVYAAFMAGLGLWFSVASRSSRRALIGTLLSCLVAMIFYLLAAYDLAGGWLRTDEAYSLLPPETLGLLAFSPADYKDWAANSLQVRTILYPLALGLCAISAIGLWFLVELRFRIVTGRERRRKGDLILSEDSIPTVPRPALATDATAPLPGKWPRLQLAFSLLQWRSIPSLLVRAGLVLLPLFLLLGWYVYSSGIAESDLREALAETDLLEPGWRLADLDSQRPALLPEKNSAVQVLKAYEHIHEKAPDLAELAETDGKIIKLGPEVQLGPDLVAHITTELAPFKSAIAEARRLADMSHGQLPAAAEGKVSPFDDRHWQFDGKVGTLAALLSSDVVLRAQGNDPKGALDSCRALINAARSIGTLPSLPIRQNRSNHVLVAILRLERALAQGEANEEALAALQDLLTDELKQPLFVLRLRAVRAGNDYLLVETLHGSADSMNEWRREPGHIASIPRAESLIALLGNSFTNYRTMNLRHFADLIAAANLPAVPRSVRFKQIESSWPPRYYLQNMGMMPPTWELARQEKWEAMLRCAIVALAAERYRLQHGAWPPSLAALAPTLITSVPIDPMDGMPLRYRRLPDGVVIYSIGSDRVDNGGNIERAVWGRMAGVDIGLRLWDPAKRRQLPGTVKSGSEPGVKPK